MIYEVVVVEDSKVDVQAWLKYSVAERVWLDRGLNEVEKLNQIRPVFSILRSEARSSLSVGTLKARTLQMSGSIN